MVTKVVREPGHSANRTFHSVVIHSAMIHLCAFHHFCEHEATKLLNVVPLSVQL